MKTLYGDVYKHVTVQRFHELENLYFLKKEAF